MIGCLHYLVMQYAWATISASSNTSGWEGLLGESLSENIGASAAEVVNGARTFTLALTVVPLGIWTRIK